MFCDSNEYFVISFTQNLITDSKDRLMQQRKRLTRLKNISDSFFPKIRYNPRGVATLKRSSRCHSRPNRPDKNLPLASIDEGPSGLPKDSLDRTPITVIPSLSCSNTVFICICDFSASTTRRACLYLTIVWKMTLGVGMASRTQRTGAETAECTKVTRLLGYLARHSNPRDSQKLYTLRG